MSKEWKYRTISALYQGSEDSLGYPEPSDLEFSELSDSDSELSGAGGTSDVPAPAWPESPGFGLA